jgi:broad specificity phosphatase PhoE
LPAGGKGLRQAKENSSLIKIFVARHGETTWNAEGRIQGRSDPGLSPKGYEQSLGLLGHLKSHSLAAIYTSTLQRSIATAEPTARYFKLTIRRQPELDEIGFGILEGKMLLNPDEEVRNEWENFKNNRWVYRIPGAENYTDVANRIDPFYKRILSQHQGQEVLVVGHRVVNRLLIGMFLDRPIEEAPNFEQTNDTLYAIAKNGKAEVFHYVDGEMREGLMPMKRPTAL